MRTPPARGMTLIELLVVVAILAVLAALSASALGPMVDRYRLMTAAEGVAQLASLAQHEARQQGRCYQVQVLAAGAPVPPGTPGDTVTVARRTNADCEAMAPPLQPDARFTDVRLPGGAEALVPGAATVPEFRPNGYTRDGQDTEILVGPIGAPSTRITIRSFGPICSGAVNPPQVCP